MSALVWIGAVFGAACVLVSLAVGAALAVARPSLARLHPRPRARLLAAAALLPAIGGALVALAVFVPHPWLGLPDHCLVDAGHLHLCLLCGVPRPPLAVVAFVLAFVGLAVARLSPELRRWMRARRLVRRLGGGEAHGDAVVLPIDGPVAFTAGFLSPRIFVSRDAADDARWRAVLAHERDHARHRDPLVRLMTRLGAALHAPFVGARIDRAMVAAQELAADEAAARDVGDRVEVAHELIAFARAARQRPAVGAGFDEGDLDHRVRVLLDAPAYLAGPSQRQLAAMALVTTVAMAGLTTSIHHVVELSVHALAA